LKYGGMQVMPRMWMTRQDIAPGTFLIFACDATTAVPAEASMEPLLSMELADSNTRVASFMTVAAPERGVYTQGMKGEQAEEGTRER
jgi:hypothetical protein